MQISTYRPNTSGASYRVMQGYKYIGDDFWDWWVWIEGNDTNLDKIDNVVYNLHYTFINPVRTVEDRNTKFRLDASGWGTFTIYVRLSFKDGSVLELKHNLRLEYPADEQPQDVKPFKR